MARAFAVARSFALAALVLSAAPAGEARACSNIIALSAGRPAVVAWAEGALDTGGFTEAALVLRRAYPALRRMSPGKDRLVVRSLRIAALVAVRTDGFVAVGPVEAPTPKALRELNLEWAVGTLRRLAELDGGDPSVATDLAEAMSKVARHREEARERLTELAALDLVTSPHAYAALARLHAARGDDAGRAKAVARCKAMARDERICEVFATAPADALPPS